MAPAAGVEATPRNRYHQTRSPDATLSKENQMPVIHVEMWPGRTYQQKQELAKAITDAVVKIANTTPEATIVIFNEVPKESWAQGGVLSSDT
jgi:4-oxalocrotonate tautomerase